jgi:glycosyltransferase involved in cell wall biosynthesis
MRCPTLKELPPPPLGKTGLPRGSGAIQRGWPWTEESMYLPPVMPEGKPWPKISIVTPSYNQGKFLEKTIRSVLLQGYPNLEYIIMDGGSNDKSVEIIKKYDKYLSFWVSEKDGGQAAAIWRGFEKATGKILAWINSDDYYLLNTFNIVGKAFNLNPEAELLIGGIHFVRESGKIICKGYTFKQKYNALLCAGMMFGQPNCFFTRESFFEVNGFNRDLRFCFDNQLFLKLLKRGNVIYTRHFLAAERRHPNSKTSTILESVGFPERQSLQKDFGIDDIPEHTRREIIENNRRSYKYNNFRGLIFDAIYDPCFFLKSSACRMRDILKAIMHLRKS